MILSQIAESKDTEYEEMWKLKFFCAQFTKHYFSKLGLGNFMTLLRIWHKGKL